MNEGKKSDCISHKDLLYSEILNTSVTGHVCDLFEKKQKSCSTHPIQRSSVLDRVSKFLKSVDKVDENIQNIEDVEEGQPVIDMNVTLIERADDSEYDSEVDLNDKDSDNETEEDESMTSSDSDKEALEYKTEDCSLYDKSVHNMFLENSEPSQSGSKDTLLKNNCVLKSLKNKALESYGQEGIPLNQQLKLSTDSDYELSDSGTNNENLFTSSDSNDEQFKNEKKEVMKAYELAMSSVKPNRFSEPESETQDENFLEFPEPDFGLPSDNISDSSCKHESSIQSSEDLRFRKRKLITIIEDGDSSNFCLTKMQKMV